MLVFLWMVMRIVLVNNCGTFATTQILLRIMYIMLNELFQSIYVNGKLKTGYNILNAK